MIGDCEAWPSETNISLAAARSCAAMISRVKGSVDKQIPVLVYAQLHARRNQTGRGRLLDDQGPAGSKSRRQVVALEDRRRLPAVGVEERAPRHLGHRSRVAPGPSQRAHPRVRGGTARTQ